MNRRALGWALVALCAGGVGDARAQAGSPTADPKLETGTVAVLVVDGSLSKPLEGLTVELIAAQGKNLAARTSPQGIATFTGLATEAAYVGRVSLPASGSEQPEPIESEPFRVPAAGGLRIVLSTKPMAAASPPPGSGGPPGMDPRRASGIPRAEPQDPAGRLTVRAIQGEFHPTDSRAPVGAEIHLIGYAADGSIEKTTKVMDASERVVFDGLVTGGRVVYYVLATFERNGVVDRLISQPISMPPQVGMRLLLAGMGVGSGAPAIDDLPKLEGADAAQAGRVIVRAGGRDMAGVDEIELVELSRPDAVVKAPLRSPTPSAAEVQGMVGEAAPSSTASPGTIEVTGTRFLSRAQTEPLGGAKVSVYEAGGTEPLATTVLGADGRASFSELGAVDGNRRYVVEVDVFGKILRSGELVRLADKGITVPVQVAWQLAGLQATFEGIPAGGDKVYLARLSAHGRTFRSTPFVLTPSAGATLNMLVFPGLVFAFHGGGEVDDDKFWFQLQVTLFNPGKEPYMPPGGKVEIPLPVGYIAPEVAEEMSTKVQPAPGGLVWRGPVPPGPASFVATFALPVDGGTMNFDWPLPMGAFQSQLILRQNPGMVVVGADGKPPVQQASGPDGTLIKVLNGVPLRETADNEGRPLLVLAGLTISPGEKLTMGVRGLPERPARESAMRIVAGLLVLAFLAWGVMGLIKARAPSATEELEARREEIFERIVALERGGNGDSAEARRLKDELGDIYRRMGAKGAG